MLQHLINNLKTNKMENLNQAVSQQNESNEGLVKLDNGQVAKLLSPNLDEGRSYAIVDQSVLNYLIDLLPLSKFYSIKHNFSQKILKTQDLSDYVKVIKEELIFQESVNLIKEYFHPINADMEVPSVKTNGAPNISDKLGLGPNLKYKLPKVVGKINLL